MANTTWNPADLVGITLSNGNLTATPTARGGVRSGDIAGMTAKYYWEVSFAATGSSSATGISTYPVNMVTTIVDDFGSAMANNAGATAVNGTQLANIGAFTAGGWCCIALDMTKFLIWFRNGAAGNWNGSAAANPATGAGGYSIAAISNSGVPPRAFTGGTGGGVSAMTANFGNVAFVGAVPAGFTAGFTSGTPIPNTALLTQEAAEQWAGTTSAAQVTQVAAEHWFMSIPPNAQMTQIVADHWATVGSVPSTAALTQIIIEQWATVMPPTLDTQARVMILA